MSTIIRGSGDTTFGGTIQSTGIDDNATSTAITIDSSENVGIGTVSPNEKLHINGSITAGVGNSKEPLIQHTNSGRVASNPGYSFNGDLDTGMFNPSLDNTIAFSTAGSERMRIDSSGNVLVGLTSGDPRNYSTGGAIKLAPAQPEFAVNDFFINKTNGDGNIFTFRSDGTTVGAIRIDADRFSIVGASYGWAMDTGDVALLGVGSNGVGVDNVLDIGKVSSRFDDIWATNGTIQTSDRNEKQDIEALSEAEQRVAVACKGLLRKFRWKDAVAEKGDDARIHFGIIAQDLQDAFAAEGLDAGRYAMFISSTWYEKQTPVDAVEAVEAVEATYDDEGNELTPAVEAVEAKDAYIRTDTEEEPTAGYTERTRLGVRYPELLAFIISAI